MKLLNQLIYYLPMIVCIIQREEILNIHLFSIHANIIIPDLISV